ncbi:MAG: GGDEF domain-containing protein [bacterium]
MVKKNSDNIFKFLLVFFIFSLVSLYLFTDSQQNGLDSDLEHLSYMDDVNSGVQRIAKLELENSFTDDMIFEMQVLVDKIKSYNEYESYSQSNPELIELVDEFISNFNIFLNTLTEYKLENNRTLLFSVSEYNYERSEIIIKVYSTHTNSISEYVKKLNYYLTLNAGVIALLLIKILIDTRKELDKNKEMSKEMFIDTSTGLYNRTKCQDIIKNTSGDDSPKDRAIIIFDLNDLKLTNDAHGHRAGDDLIASFAAQLREATKIFSEEIFVGRYGGDEFMAYFSSAEVKDVEQYLKQVDFLINEFNETKNKVFKLSCAAGYSITNSETRSKKTREIFDEADENMYKNKIAMKAKKRQELLESGVKIEEIIDDRL